MNYILILVSVCFFCLNGTMTRWFQTKTGRVPSALRLYQAGFCFVSFVLNIAVNGLLIPTRNTMLFGIAYGFFYAFATFCSAECYRVGSMSLTSVIMNMSMAIPMLFSFIVYGDDVLINQGIGLVLLVATFILASLPTKKTAKQKTAALWLPLIIIAFFSNGITAVIQKVVINKEGDVQGTTLLTVSFLTATIVFLLLYLLDRAKEEKCTFKEMVSSVPSFVVVTAASGAGSIFGSVLLGKLCLEVSSTVLYPCLNGGLAVMTALVSFLLFREKIYRAKLLSILIGLCAIVLLAI